MIFVYDMREGTQMSVVEKMFIVRVFVGVDFSMNAASIQISDIRSFLC